MSKVVVLGSINQDVVASTLRHPAPGETVMGESLQQFPGGKGANQAVAAARSGAPTVMMGAVGDDDFGRANCDFLDTNGVDVSRVRSIDDVSTGTALIVVDRNGENTIVIVPGANGRATDDATLPLAVSDVLLAQLEVPMDNVTAFFARGKAAGCTTILNPSPMAPLSKELLAATDVLIINQAELSALSDLPLSDDDDVASTVDHARKLAFSGHVIVTLGSRGAVAVNEQGLHESPGHAVAVVDTTGAGDCFAGALAARLVQADSISQAMNYANRAAAISVTRSGAGPSMPTTAEVLN